MDPENLETRLTAIEARLADISDGLGKLDGLTTKLDSVIKAQVLLGSLVESGQTETRRRLTETLPQELATTLKDSVGAEIGALSGRLAEAIGTALGDRTYADLSVSSDATRPLDIVLRDLGATEDKEKKA